MRGYVVFALLAAAMLELEGFVELPALGGCPLRGGLAYWLIVGVSDLRQAYVKELKKGYWMTFVECISA